MTVLVLSSFQVSGDDGVTHQQGLRGADEASSDS
jgi:hypothetical protein